MLLADWCTVNNMILQHVAIRSLPQVEGEVTYNGESMGQFYPERTAAYVPQVPHKHSRSLCAILLSAPVAGLLGVQAAQKDIQQQLHAQDDVHIAKLSVQETLDFSACCQGKGFLPGASRPALHIRNIACLSEIHLHDALWAQITARHSRLHQQTCMRARIASVRLTHASHWLHMAWQDRQIAGTQVAATGTRL